MTISKWVLVFGKGYYWPCRCYQWPSTYINYDMPWVWSPASHTHIQGSSFLLLFGNLKSSCPLQLYQKVVYIAFYICYSSSVNGFILSLFHHSLKEEICWTIQTQRNSTKLLYIRRCNSKKKNVSRNVYHSSKSFAHFIKIIYIYNIIYYI